jgi:hypothetical protein
MKKRRPDIDEYSFGTVGLAYVQRADNKDVRGEMSVMLEQKGSDSYRIYIPTRKLVYSVRRFEPLRSNSYPLQWNWERKEEFKLEGKSDVNYDMISKNKINIEGLDRKTEYNELSINSNDRIVNNVADHVNDDNELDNEISNNIKETISNTDDDHDNNKEINNNNANDLDNTRNDKLENSIVNTDTNDIKII